MLICYSSFKNIAISSKSFLPIYLSREFKITNATKTIPNTSENIKKSKILNKYSFGKTIMKKLRNHLLTHNSTGKLILSKCFLIFEFEISISFVKAKHKNFKTGNSLAYIPKYKFFLFLKKFMIKSQASKELKPD